MTTLTQSELDDMRRKAVMSREEAIACLSPHSSTGDGATISLTAGKMRVALAALVNAGDRDARITQLTAERDEALATIERERRQEEALRCDFEEELKAAQSRIAELEAKVADLESIITDMEGVHERAQIAEIENKELRARVDQLALARIAALFHPSAQFVAGMREAAEKMIAAWDRMYALINPRSSFPLVFADMTEEIEFNEGLKLRAILAEAALKGHGVRAIETYPTGTSVEDVMRGSVEPLTHEVVSYVIGEEEK